MELLDSRRVLLALPANHETDPRLAQWAEGAARALTDLGATVQVLAPADDEADAVAEAAQGLTGRDIVLAVGAELADRLAGTPLAPRLWAMPQSDPTSALGPASLKALSPAIDRLVVTDATHAGWAEGLEPSLIGRVLRWPADHSSDALARSLSGAWSAPRSSGFKTRVLLCGRDFKFASALMAHLNSRDDIEFRVDLHTYDAPPADVDALADWAEIVVCEFAQEHAVWHSRNLRAGQQLVVRLHGYELFTGYADDLAIDNCAAVVLVSEHQRATAVERGWPAEKLHVIPNVIDIADFDRPKIGDPRFALGLVGMAPALKRPDRAVDLLERLLDHDPRYRLHVRGHWPWHMRWEWANALHREAHLHLFRRIADDDRLRAAVVFEGFSPAIANWYRKIGWVLSPSQRESFHLAPVEGMAGGAIPVVWDRVGARDIFSSRWTHDSTEQAAAFIVRHNATAHAYAEESDLARDFVERYGRQAANDAWDRLLDGLPRLLPALPADLDPPSAPVAERPATPVLQVRLSDGTPDQVAGSLASLARQSLHPALFEVVIADPAAWAERFPSLQLVGSSTAPKEMAMEAGTVLDESQLLNSAAYF